MKYNIKSKYTSLTNAFNNTFHNVTLTPGNKPIYLHNASHINNLWQAWNAFWRVFWLAYLRGGIDINGNHITPYNPLLNEESSVGLILFRNTRPIAHYSEKSWGDIKWITTAATNLTQLDTGPVLTLPISLIATRVGAAISLHNMTIEHLQIIRNASIHLDKPNMIKSKSILTRYTLSNIKYPTDILSANLVTSGSLTLVSWITQMHNIIDELK